MKLFHANPNEVIRQAWMDRGPFTHGLVRHLASSEQDLLAVVVEGWQ